MENNNLIQDSALIALDDLMREAVDVSGVDDVWQVIVGVISTSAKREPLVL